MKMNTGSFIANGNAVNVNVGFIPDLVIAFEGQEETNPQIHYWLRERIDAASAEAQFGILDTGGTKTKHAAAVNGFAVFDQATNQIKLPHPSGEGELAAAVPTEFLAGAAQPTARTVSVLGSTVRPSTSKLTGYIYECTVSAGVLGTEPTTWPSVPGETISDGTNTWITREEKVFQGVAKGFTLGATGQTDSDEWTWIAFAADKVTTEVDSVSNDPV